MWSLLFARKSLKIAGEVFYRHVVLARCPISSQNTEGKGQIKNDDDDDDSNNNNDNVIKSINTHTTTTTTSV